MCGVVGVFVRGRMKGTNFDSVAAASETLRHRGPDESGEVRGDHFAIAHRRLSIIDLSGSHQPMGDDGDLLAFNGEILNYRTLAASLSHARTATGDTEVLLELLRSRGVTALPSVRGQYAFAWVHERGEVLTLARDPRGILPMYYAIDGNQILFASEVKALLPLLSGEPKIDRVSLGEYFVTRAVYSPYTMYEGIFKLLPGEIIDFWRDGRVSRSSPSREQVPCRDQDITLQAATDRLELLLHDSVEQALTADVPVGCYLSGGLDSSLITALARQRIPAVHTFSAGFEAEGFEGELSPARFVAEQVGSTHHEVRLTREEFLGSLSRLTWHRDAPLSEPADVAVAALARAASDHVRVVLSGEGADELFLGYPKHRAEAVLGPLLARPLTAPLVRAVDAAMGSSPMKMRRLRIALRAAASPTSLERWLAWFSSFDINQAAALVGINPEQILMRMRARQECLAIDAQTPLDAMAVWDLNTWLADNLLERGERMTMASSVELRPPYLDAPVVEFAQRLPTKMLLGGGGKMLLRLVAQRHLPQSVTSRRKAGFPMPLATWFGQHGFIDAATDLSGSAIAGALDQDIIQRLAMRHLTGTRDESARLWPLVSALEWGKQAFANSGSLA